ncbi:hypothetical protein ACHAXT_003262 [Thalassiosira profunda]
METFSFVRTYGKQSNQKQPQGEGDTRCAAEFSPNSMVKHGHFELVLIRADEKGTPFEEHSAPDDGDGGGKGGVFAEVEPEAEFYLRLSSDAPETVYADLKVDGQPIKTGHRLKPGRKASTVGVLASESHAGEWASTEVALRFARAQVYDSSTKGEACTYWTGQVEATFYGNPSYHIPTGVVPALYKAVKSEESSGVKAEETKVEAKVQAAPVVSSVTPSTSGGVTYGKRKTTYMLAPSLSSTDVGFVPGKSDDKQKKGVKSAKGTKALRTHNLNWTSSKPKPKKRVRNATNVRPDPPAGPEVREPEYLGKVTLNYCSTVGLIHAGILDKPPNWDVERLKLAVSQQTKQDHAKILSEVKVQHFTLKNERISGTGEKITEMTDVEILDLTEMDD